MLRSSWSLPAPATPAARSGAFREGYPWWPAAAPDTAEAPAVKRRLGLRDDDELGACVELLTDEPLRPRSAPTAIDSYRAARIPAPYAHNTSLTTVVKFDRRRSSSSPAPLPCGLDPPIERSSSTYPIPYSFVGSMDVPSKYSFHP